MSATGGIMIKFNTKLALTDYIATGKARETIYEIEVDETLQGMKTVYKYTNGTLVLLSENITSYNWRNSVNTFADIASVTAPIGMDAVVVLSDETRNGQRADQPLKLIVVAFKAEDDWLTNSGPKQAMRSYKIIVENPVYNLLKSC